MTDPVITATDVHKSFGDEGVLEGVDLTVREGETLVLMGPNGAGKSVLLSCLAGGARPDDGEIEVLGAPATERDDTTSFLLQDALAHEKLTGRENVAFYERLHPAFTDRWRDSLERLDLDDRALERTVEEYSGGMTRKLELAIAASIDAPIYLFDEPTAPLDLTTIGTVHELFREKRDAGKTLVVTSHRPMDADVADRIAFLANGQIVATGTPEDLLASVPPVLETGATNAAELAEGVVGEPYAVAGSVRGFVPQERDESGSGSESGSRSESTVIDGIADETGIDPDALSTVEPTYTDLFNYHTNGASTPNADGSSVGHTTTTTTTTTATTSHESASQ